MKSNVILSADAFEKYIKVSNKDYGNNPLYCVSLRGHTYQFASKYRDIKLQTHQDKDLILLTEHNIGGGITSVMGGRYVKTNDNNKILHVDTTNIYGQSVSQMLIYDEIELWHGFPDLYMNN